MTVGRHRSSSDPAVGKIYAGTSRYLTTLDSSGIGKPSLRRPSRWSLIASQTSDSSFFDRSARGDTAGEIWYVGGGNGRCLLDHNGIALHRDDHITSGEFGQKRLGGTP
jgi:hypothetical protein